MFGNHIKEYIKKENLIIGQAYFGHGRNFDTAIWDGIAFHGVRRKFNAIFMDKEYHWDTEEHKPHGTFKPVELLEPKTEKAEWISSN